MSKKHTHNSDGRKNVRKRHGQDTDSAGRSSRSGPHKRYRPSSDEASGTVVGAASQRVSRRGTRSSTPRSRHSPMPTKQIKTPPNAPSAATSSTCLEQSLPRASPLQPDSPVPVSHDSPTPAASSGAPPSASLGTTPADPTANATPALLESGSPAGASPAQLDGLCALPPVCSESPEVQNRDLGAPPPAASNDDKKSSNGQSSVNPAWLKRLSLLVAPKSSRGSGPSCIGYSLPLYLVPFALANQEMRSVYCILVTVVTLATGFLPQPITAFVPVILIQVTGIMAPEEMAAELMNIKVITACLLFMVIIIGDQTPVFSRLALRVLCNLGFRAPLLFSYTVAASFVSTFLLPSDICVIFTTAVVERFMANLEEDLSVLEQQWSRTSRKRTSSDTFDQFGESGVRNRSKRLRVSLGPEMVRMTEAMSRKSRTTLVGAGLGPAQSDWPAPSGPLLVKEYKIHPEPSTDAKEEAQTTKRAPRKTSFEPFGVVTKWAPHLPVRRIRSFSEQGAANQAKRSSILKGTKTPESPAPPTDSAQSGPSPDPSLLDAAPPESIDVIVTTSPFSRRPSILKPTGGSVQASSRRSPPSPEASPSPRMRTASRRSSILKDVAAIRMGSKIDSKRASVLSFEIDGQKRSSDGGIFARKSGPLKMVEDYSTRLFIGPPRPAYRLPRFIAGQQSASFESQPNTSTDSRRVQTMCVSLRTAFLLGATLTAVFGNLASFWNVAARAAILRNLSKYATAPLVHGVLAASVYGMWRLVCEQAFIFRCRGTRDSPEATSSYEPITAWNWFTVTLPVALTGCLVCAALIYVVYLVPFEELDDSIQEDIKKCAKARLRELSNRCVQETIMTYWLLGFPFYFASNISRSTEAAYYMEAPLLSISAIVMTMLPAAGTRPLALRRLASWELIRSRMPWAVVVTYGTVSSLTKLAQERNVVNVLFDWIGPRFWERRSAHTAQLLLCVLAAFLSEFIGNSTLNDLMVPVVVRIASAARTHPLYFVVPVGVIASANVILPMSLPLLMLRESLDIPCTRMILTGLVLKTALVLSMLFTMNTLGTLIFSSQEIEQVLRMVSLTPAGTNVTRLPPQRCHSVQSNVTDRNPAETDTDASKS
ncbi:uncharacterized protein LOC144115299 [Amblyomma americanum]